MPQDGDDLITVFGRCEADDPYACLEIARRYEQGIGGLLKRPDLAASAYKKAHELLLPLAHAGNAEAQYNLGCMYSQGLGVLPDYAQAVAWYRRAVEQGHAGAQNNLGVMYVEGLGVSQDYEEAYVWFSLAAAQGDVDAAHNRDVAERRLTPEALEWAQARATALHARIHGGLDMAP
jgi:uncharacterized protein